MIEKRLLYLATPYSHPNPMVREARFHLACDAAAMLLGGGTHVISPIAHTHPIACRHDLPKGFEFWRKYDTAMISRCDGLIVVMADGWEQSLGIAGEIEIADSLRKPVYYLPWPATYEDWLHAFEVQNTEGSHYGVERPDGDLAPGAAFNAQGVEANNYWTLRSDGDWEPKV